MATPLAAILKEFMKLDRHDGTKSQLQYWEYGVNAHVSQTRCKEIESLCVIQCPPQYKLIRCHGLNSMTLIKVDDIYNVSP